eukprot:5134214-Karenia_brevis.AAC.1
MMVMKGGRMDVLGVYQRKQTPAPPVKKSCKNAITRSNPTWTFVRPQMTPTWQFLLCPSA